MSSDKKTNKRQSYSGGSDRLKTIFAGIILIIGILCELYVMINNHSNIALLAVFALVVLFAAYIIMTTLIGSKEYKEQLAREEYDNIIKSEKASYLLMRKYFSELEERISELEVSLDTSVQEIINSQKAVAKLTINKEKENLAKVHADNERLAAKVEELHNKQGEQAERHLQLRQDIIGEINDASSSIKDGMLQMGRVSYVQPQMVAPQAAPVPAPVAVPEPVPAPVVEEIAIPEPEPVVEEIAVPEPEPVVEEISIPEPEPVVEEIAIPEPEPVVEEIAIPEPVVEEVPIPEPIIEEPSVPEMEAIPDDMVGEIPAEFIAEAITEDAAAAEPAAPVLEGPSDDPNHIMTPEEIAALVAGASAEPEIVAEPEPEPVLEEEAAPAAPEIDLSDPNHIMTPDEIAALLASM